MAAIAVAIAYGVIPAFIIGSCLAWMVSTKVLDSGFLGTLLKSFLYYSLYVVMGRAVSRVILPLITKNGVWSMSITARPKD